MAGSMEARRRRTEREAATATTAASGERQWENYGLWAAVLERLTAAEVACVALVDRSRSAMVRRYYDRRCADASCGLERHPIPFLASPRCASIQRSSPYPGVQGRRVRRQYTLDQRMGHVCMGVGAEKTCCGWGHMLVPGRYGARYADDYIYCRANLTAAGEPVSAVEARFTGGGCVCTDSCVRSLQQQQQQPATSLDDGACSCLRKSSTMLHECGAACTCGAWLRRPRL